MLPDTYLMLCRRYYLFFYDKFTFKFQATICRMHNACLATNLTIIYNLINKIMLAMG